MARSAGRGRRAARAQGKKQGLWVAGLLALVAWGLVVLMLWVLMVVMLGWRPANGPPPEVQDHGLRAAVDAARDLDTFSVAASMSW
jgi:hypothetical protein